MPTTTYTDSTFEAATIGARTDSAGAAVSDLSAEENRLINSILNAGYLTPAGSFQVAAQAVPDMSVKVGTGSAKSNYYVLAGTVAGQGNYLVRLDVASVTVNLSASDPTDPRTDEVYLVIRDNLYDVSSRALPQIGYRNGDLGGANPGPDAGWTAYALLARVAVAGAATTITSGNITDQRSASSLLSSLGGNSVQNTLADAKGDTIAATAADTFARVAVGTNGHVYTADSALAAGVKWAAPVAAASADIATSESTTSTSYTDLATVGPSVTLTVGPLGIAIVSVSSETNFLSDDDHGRASFAMSGANTLAAADRNCVAHLLDGFGIAESVDIRASAVTVLTGLTAGSTTFTMKYKVVGNVNFLERKLGVVTF